MPQHEQPFISAEQRLPELTLKVICLSVILTVILAASNAYLALKIGILTSASIPAAVLSMGFLRLFKQSNILENNLVQTAASAGEAVAGGVVYTLPALIIIHYWFHFSYWENLAIALSGGILGVLFSIPLRKVLVTDSNLQYPEGKAIAQLLKLGEQRSIGFKEMLLGGAVGALLEFAQVGLQLIAGSIQKWFVVGKAYLGFGAGFSASLIGAGYLMGIRVGFSILTGAILGWLIGIPVLSLQAGIATLAPDTTRAVMIFWSEQVRYIGIGAMLTAGSYTLLTLFKPFYASMQASAKAMEQHQFGAANIPRTERDIPFAYVLTGIILILLALYGLLKHIFYYHNLGLPEHLEAVFLIGCLAYILAIGFIFSAICGYFSGLVGVTASPGSAIVIAGFVIAALLIRSVLPTTLSSTQLSEAAAITIILGAIITSAASIANDNMQDLKVGHLIGATPWKQQLMLILGVILAAAVIPPVMELLFKVYGIADVMPRTGMDPSKTLAAPPAAMMAAVAQAVFNHHLPWNMIILGAAIILCIIGLNLILDKKGLGLSTLAVAIGMYLPLTSSMPLFIGASFAWLNGYHFQKRLSSQSKEQQSTLQQKNILLSCGLVAGSALIDVLLAIPFGISHDPDIFRLMPANNDWLAQSFAIISVILLGLWFHKNITSSNS